MIDPSLTSPPPPNSTLEPLRRKLTFRAWHRGTREADLLIGTFADRHIASFDAEQLAQFDRLLAENDPDIYEWMTGQSEIPAEHINSVTALLRRFRFVAKSS
jgi:antitoxin CptB